jgi:hypothetical protein
MQSGPVVAGLADCSGQKQPAKLGHVRPGGKTGVQMTDTGTTQPQPETWQEQGSFPYPEEGDRIAHRRRQFFAGADVESDETVNARNSPPLWGLALSGGGIRSATFCLGVLQALARADFGFSGDTAKALKAGAGEPDSGQEQAKLPLLARFDYLSTVSGGGYAGSFLSGLFHPRQIEGQGDIKPEVAAEAAFDTLSRPTPGRMGEAQSADDGEVPMRWLRENGRYMAPTGAGDLVYDAAIALRNMFAVHFVGGITLMTICLSLFALRYLLDAGSLGSSLACIAVWAERLVQPAQPWVHGTIWFSPGFVVVAAVGLVFVAPTAVAYWLRLEGDGNGKHRPFLAVVVLIAASVCGYVVDGMRPPAVVGEGSRSLLLQPRPFAFLAMAGILGLSLLYYKLAAMNGGGDTRIYRARMTRWLTRSLLGFVGLVLFGLVETGGQTLYLWLQTKAAGVPTVAGVLAAISAFAALVRQFAPLLAQPREDGLLSRLPMDLLFTVGGLLLLFVVLILWHALALWLFLGNYPPGIGTPVPNPEAIIIMQATAEAPPGMAALCKAIGLLWILCLVTTIACGSFIGFINLSSLQTMYSARLLRAYLGASNRNRFKDLPSQPTPVTEPDPHDDFTPAEYYDKRHLGPVHLINVTVNATSGSGDQLTQRDRQGLPMVLSPDGPLVEGEPVKKGPSWAGTELKISYWIGISGAAFTTGLGRGTSLGKAILLSLVNVRLGWWWESGQKPDKAGDFTLWRNQAYLWRELKADFKGRDGSHWYLSDGGHFENTGVFELLRRKVGVVVCCDCGADPNYRFEDLANLMRLARIDLGIEFKPLSPAEARSALFPRHEGRIEDYLAASEAELARAQLYKSIGEGGGQNNKCALAYSVQYPDRTTSLLLVIKPRLIEDAPLDLREYQGRNPDFPQQTTMDQFFDDAQWESYRKLGSLIGSALFPRGK